MLTDAEDYSAFLNGDNEGFERLVIRYKDGLIYYLNRIIKNITINLQPIFDNIQSKILGTIITYYQIIFKIGTI